MNSEAKELLDGSSFRDLPYSAMIYPRSLRDRAKYVFWRVYTPYHPFVRDTALALGVVRHEGRQHFLLGKVAPHISIQEFVERLVAQGFGNHFVAWEDEGELVSLRYVEDFKCQYHLRVFKDGEVRAHYEYTPECYPILHLREVGIEARRDDFLRMLGDTIMAH